MNSYLLFYTCSYRFVLILQKNVQKNFTLACFFAYISFLFVKNAQNRVCKLSPQQEIFEFNHLELSVHMRYN